MTFISIWKIILMINNKASIDIDIVDFVFFSIIK